MGRASRWRWRATIRRAHSIEVYLKQTAIANPHLTITYQDPQGKPDPVSPAAPKSFRLDRQT